MKQKQLLKQIRTQYPKLLFTEDDSYLWSPVDSSVHYIADDDTVTGLWSLLHETSHGILAHSVYRSDFELVQLEVAAWVQAEELADNFSMKIDEDHIQDCLDSYRDWHYKRSLCPRCNLGGVQIDERTYTCFFCHGRWAVSTARFCRPYRRKATK